LIQMAERTGLEPAESALGINNLLIRKNYYAPEIPFDPRISR
jgi:hypothetical protein